MKNVQSLLAVPLLSFLLAFPLKAEEPPARFDFVRPLSMGGAFVAVADDQNIFNFNPAGMVQRTGGEFTLLEVAGGVAQDTLEVLDFISDNESDLTNIGTSPRRAELVNEIKNNISKLNPRVYVAADIASYVSGPSFMGLPLHVGFGAFGVIDASFNLNPGILIPNISYTINNDLIFPLSLAKRWKAPIIPGRIGVGVTGKIIRRSQVSRQNQSILELDDLETPPIATGTGFGMDLGFLYQPTDRFNLGMMVRDFGGTNLSFDKVDAEDGFQALPERDTTIRPRTDIGIALVPEKILFFLPTTDRWTLSADVRDVFNKEHHILFEDGFKNVIGEDFYTHLHLGAEFRYWFFRFRGGFNQGYPTFGLGLDIPLLKLDYAFYSVELGDQAGDLRQGNHIVSLAFRFGSGKVEARERIEKAKESKSQRQMGTPDEVPEAEPMESPSEEAEPTEAAEDAEIPE